MAWQDYVLSIGSWVFVIALIPAIRGRDKPPLSTSVVTGSILVIYAFVYATLHLWLSVVSMGVMSLCWFTLAVQKYRRKNSL